ncbi:TPA: phosphoglycerate mutase, partial [Stenotrophomonas maltophilia]|nr:phosphoglycerate mutase [Stenotrophomonas maltophilia]
PGERAQLTRHFTVAAPQWPVAALTRQRDVGDAAGASWLRADPACMVPDMHGARMMAYGETLRPTLADCLALLPVLQPLFADAGFVLDAPDPSRWYLRLPIDLALPDFDSPDEVLGDDLFSHLPEGEGGRRWRALMTEAQVLLHNHSWNQQRAAQGQQPINSLWFWGGGVMPVSVSTPHAQVRSRDALLQGLALAAGVAVDGEQAVDALVDLRQLRSLQQLGNDAIRPLLAALKRGELQRLVLDFEDGLQFQLDRGQHWQFWKKPRQLHD